MKRQLPLIASVLAAGVCLGIGAAQVGSTRTDTRDVATFNDGFEDGARDIREQLAPIIANNPDECWIRENLPGIPNAPQWCND